MRDKHTNARGFYRPALFSPSEMIAVLNRTKIINIIPHCYQTSFD